MLQQHTCSFQSWFKVATNANFCSVKLKVGTDKRMMILIQTLCAFQSANLDLFAFSSMETLISAISDPVL